MAEATTGEAREGAGGDGGVTAAASYAIELAIAQEAWDEVIERVRAALEADPAGAMGDPVIAGWMARRYRSIFIDEAVADPTALAHAQRHFPADLVDHRSDRQKVAERMFRHPDPVDWQVTLPPAQVGALGGTTLVFAPGLITGYMPSLAFQSVFPRILERFGVPILSSDSHPVRSSTANVADLEAAIERGIGNAPDPEGTLITADDDPQPPAGDLLLMGYSKGAPDISEFLVARPDLAPRVRAVVSWAGANGGSPLANDMYAKVKDLSDPEIADNLLEHVGALTRRFVPFGAVKRLDRRLDEYDVKGALYSLTTEYREQFNAQNAATLDAYGIPTLYFTGATTAREVAYFNLSGELELDQYDPLNDMQLTQREATPPVRGKAHGAMFHANHWDLSYDTWPWYETGGSLELREPFARYPAMAAIVLLLAEVGLLT